MLLGPRRSLEQVEPGLSVISATQTQRQTRLLVRTDGPVLDPSWEQGEVGLEDVILAYMGNEGASTTAGPPTDADADAVGTAGPKPARRHLEVAP